MKTWLRGGLWGMGLGLVFALLYFSLMLLCAVTLGCAYFGKSIILGFLAIFLRITTPVSYLSKFIRIESSTILPTLALNIFLNIVIYFIIGAIIGLIIQKIKERKK